MKNKKIIHRHQWVAAITTCYGVYHRVADALGISVDDVRATIDGDPALRRMMDDAAAMRDDYVMDALLRMVAAGDMRALQLYYSITGTDDDKNKNKSITIIDL